MRFRTITAFLTTTVILAACSDSATAPNSSVEAELEDVVFDIDAPPNDVVAAQDRRQPGNRPPRELTDAQKKCVQDAIAAFRDANKSTLEALKAIHAKARAAKAAGAAREEIRKILQEAQPLLERLRPAHQALHKKLRECVA